MSVKKRHATLLPGNVSRVPQLPYSLGSQSQIYYSCLHLAKPLIAKIAWAEVICKINQPLRLFQNLVYEMQHFQVQLKIHYPEPFVKIASYLLCIALDALIVGPLAQAQKKLSLQPLLYYFHHDLQEKKRFFKITEVLLKNKNIPRELSMLAYFCLALGYQGQVSGNPEGLTQHTSDNLYYLIKASLDKSLYKKTSDKILKQLQEEKINQWLMLVCCVISLIFCICYMFFTVKLNYYCQYIYKLY